jgi:hypothetical protein
MLSISFFFYRLTSKVGSANVVNNMAVKYSSYPGHRLVRRYRNILSLCFRDWSLMYDFSFQE